MLSNPPARDKLDIRNNRLAPNAMETRAAIASTTRQPRASLCGTRRQNPHVARLVISAFVALTPEHKCA